MGVDPCGLEARKLTDHRLRQTCLHPEAGERNKKAFGQRNGPLRTVEEVLAVMIEQHMVQMRADERTLFQSMIKRGQLYEATGKIDQAMVAWEEALEMVQVSVTECRKALAEEIELVTRTRRESKKDSTWKAKAADEYSGDESIESDDQPEKKSQRVGTARNRLKNALELEHACYFWLGTAYYQLQEKAEEKKDANDEKQSSSAPDQGKTVEYKRKESEYYDLAKKLRLELMQESRKKALAYISEFQRKKERQDFAVVPDITPPEEGAGGIESQRILDAIGELADVLNEQVIMFDEFREKLVALILEPLVDQDDDKELEGNEIEVSVEKQEESYAYMSVLRALLADREQALNDAQNLLIQQDTQAAMQRPSKMHKTLFLQLIALKNKVNPVLGGHKSMRRLLNDLRSLISNLRQTEEGGSGRARLERAVAEQEYKELQKMQAIQIKATQDSFKYSPLPIL
jgi:E3 ubiquitin-protein ligase SHPRH